MLVHLPTRREAGVVLQPGRTSCVESGTSRGDLTIDAAATAALLDSAGGVPRFGLWDWGWANRETAMETAAAIILYVVLLVPNLLGRIKSQLPTAIQTVPS
jgi:hypothetical protein